MIICSDCLRKREEARKAATKAIRDGIIVKPSTCSACGATPKPIDLHGHHAFGYEPENALRLVWLCRRCHTGAPEHREVKCPHQPEPVRPKQRLQSREVAAQLGISLAKLRIMRRQRKIAYSVTPGGRYLFDQEDIDSAIQRFEPDPPQ